MSFRRLLYFSLWFFLSTHFPFTIWPFCFVTCFGFSYPIFLQIFYFHFLNLQTHSLCGWLLGAFLCLAWLIVVFHTILLVLFRQKMRDDGYSWFVLFRFLKPKKMENKFSQYYIFKAYIFSCFSHFGSLQN